MQFRKNPVVAVIVGVLSMAIVAAPLPRSRARASQAARDGKSLLAVPSSHFLRDAVPTAGFTSQPEDTTDDDDDEFLPEEKETSKLVWEIAAWIVGAALVAFFIIKVFIEEDTDEGDDGGSTKPDPF